MSNIQPYIILNGTDSRSITGLLISVLAPISKPLQRTLVDTVDGRDGDLVTPLGFSAYDKIISIALTYGYDIDDIIEYFNSEGVVTFSNEPDKYYRYAIYEQIDFERLIRFKTAEVTLHCQPFKFSTTETPKLFNVTSGSPITVKNDGNYQSRPNLTIIGSGDVDLSLNGSQVLSLDLEDNQAVIIDTEDMNAYAAQTAIKEVIAEINPVQDLHGQEYPYPAGGGKNIVPLTISNIKNANTSGTWVNNVYTHNGMAFSIEIDEAGNVIGIKANGTASGGSSILRLGNFELSENTYALNGLSHAGSQSTFRLILTNSSYSTSYSIMTSVGDSLYTALASTYGLQIVISAGTQMSNEMFYPMIRLASIVDSTFAPYSNICPITGFTESNVTRTGKNLYPYENVARYTYSFAVNTAFNQMVNPIFLRAGKTYTLSIESGKTLYRMRAFNKYGELITDPDKINMTSNSRLLSFYGNYNFYGYSGTANNINLIQPTVDLWLDCTVQNSTASQVQLELGATATTYEQYQGTVYNIPFEDDQGDPITAYKGRINFTTGVLTLDGQIVDMSDLNYTKYDVAEGTLFRTQISGAKLTYNVDNLLCSIYRFATKEQRANGTYSIPDNVGNLDFINDSYTSASDFKTAMSGQTLLFELAEPIEIQLTPTIINNLLGLNQMYADNNGDISVTFSSNGVIQTETDDIVSFNVAVEDMQKGILLNRLVIGDYDKIRLSKGDNTIVLTGGAQQFVIDKYSRWL